MDTIYRIHIIYIDRSFNFVSTVINNETNFKLNITSYIYMHYVVVNSRVSSKKVTFSDVKILISINFISVLTAMNTRLRNKKVDSI